MKFIFDNSHLFMASYNDITKEITINLKLHFIDRKIDNALKILNWNIEHEVLHYVLHKYIDKFKSEKTTRALDNGKFCQKIQNTKWIIKNRKRLNLYWRD